MQGETNIVAGSITLIPSSAGEGVNLRIRVPYMDVFLHLSDEKFLAFKSYSTVLTAVQFLDTNDAEVSLNEQPLGIL